VKTRQLAASAILLALAGTFTIQSAARSVTQVQGTPQTHERATQVNGTSAHSVEELHALHRKCLEAAKRLQHDVFTMEPGRAWRWRLDSEKSRSQLDGLRRNLKAFRQADLAFESSLSSEQKSKFHSHLSSTRALFEHLQRDAESLDTELRNGYPTRWHVAKDVEDMRKEVNRWRRLHQRLADALGLKA
jgi:hypothetical protein